MTPVAQMESALLDITQGMKTTEAMKKNKVVNLHFYTWLKADDARLARYNDGKPPSQQIRIENTLSKRAWNKKRRNEEKTGDMPRLSTMEILEPFLSISR